MCYPSGKWSPVRLNIEELIIDGAEFNHGEIDQQVNFIIGCQKVKYLTIKTCDRFRFHDFKQMAINLPELIEINFEYSRIPLAKAERNLDAMLEFIRRCKNLRLFKLRENSTKILWSISKS